MEFIRARSDAQKNMRLEQIVRAAAELYETQPFDRITLAAIAERLDFSRANLYKYVSSKEEIYLLVLSSDLNRFVEVVLARFQGVHDLSPEEFAIRWSKALYDHERLLRLLSVLFSLIEKNVSVEALASFKADLFRNMSRLESLFQEALPFYSTDQIYTFLHMQLHYAAGLYPATAQNEIQQEAVRISGVPYVCQDFVTTFAQFLVTVLRGLTQGISP